MVVSPVDAGELVAPLSGIRRGLVKRFSEPLQ
jgi:hypothetical protein